MKQPDTLFAIILAAAAATAAGGCAPRPQLAEPPPVLSTGWQAGSERIAGDVPLSASWSAFHSPELDALIARARIANADIAIARARIVQARGRLRAARAALAPTVSARAETQVTRGEGSTTEITSRDQAVGLEVAYEVDLFGAARAGRRAAAARVSVAGFERDAAALLVESEVARTYVEHAALGARLALLDRALANARETERIILVRVREGAANRVESGFQTVEVRRIEEQRSRLAEARTQTRNALAVLVGEEAPRFSLEGTDLEALASPAFEAVQPAELLVRRPDLRAAEATILASEGDVAQARAAFLPSLSITARALLESGSGGGPLQAVLAAGAGILAPIFDGGRLKGQLMTVRGEQQEAVETYRRTILVALREGEDAMTALDEAQRRLDLLTQSLQDARTAARLARLQFLEGAADLQTVFDAERGLLDLEEARALAAQDRLNAAIDLYKAMGGEPAVA